MKRESWLELQNEKLNFSAGHFTIFSATERENLHGHNYFVYVGLKVCFDDDSLGLAFDYRTYKKKIQQLCTELNQCVLLPEKSPYLTLEHDDNYCYAIFNNERMPFLARDIKILPVSNITLEELSVWFVNKLTQDKQALTQNGIKEMIVKVYSAPGQSCSANWSDHE
jgi:6-pyruvoyltetrahydropterin/6-carboxytetrahydropterin synthase